MSKAKGWLEFLVGIVIASILVLPLNAQQPQSVQAPTPKSARHSKTKAKQNPQEFTLVGAETLPGAGNLLGAEATAKLIEKLPDRPSSQRETWPTKRALGKISRIATNRLGASFRIGHALAGQPRIPGIPWNWLLSILGRKSGRSTEGLLQLRLGKLALVVLNTNCSVKALGGCGEGSPEEMWLREDLAAHPDACIIAYGHHSLFSSGILPSHAVHPELRAFWRDLYQADADLVLAGHEHSYERFGPQTPDGQLDEKNGIRQIVVGTGGKKSHHTWLCHGKQ